MPTPSACCAVPSASRSLWPLPRPSTRALLLSFSGTLTATLAGPAAGIVSLDPKHEPFAIINGQTGVANSVVSIQALWLERLGAVPNTIGGLDREGASSGVLIDSGQNYTWMITSGKNLAGLGRWDESDTQVWQPDVSIGLGNNFNTNNNIDIEEWYLAGPADGPTSFSPRDYGLVKLPIAPSELGALGLTTVPIYRRDTLEELSADINGEVIDLVGYGASGTGATGGTNFDGQRRWGQNRIEPWFTTTNRLSSLRSGNYFTIDFDVDRDDDLYDVTPEVFTDRNPVWELPYFAQNAAEIAISGTDEPRQNPEADFRVPFESMVSAGDAGGGAFLGGSLVGLPISNLAAPLDESGDGSASTIGSGYGSETIFITLSEHAQEIQDLIFFAEQAEIDFLNGDRDTFTLTDNELSSIGNGFSYGAVDLNPIFNFQDQAETNNRRGNAAPTEPLTEDASSANVAGLAGDLSLGPEVERTILLTEYYSGRTLTAVAKAKLLSVVPYTTSDSLSDAELIALIDNEEFDTIELIEDALSFDMRNVYGEPSEAMATWIQQTIAFYPTNNDAPLRSQVVGPDLNTLGDFNGDGGFDSTDIDAFIADMLAGDEWTDLNGDGVNNDLDTVAYVEGFLSQLMGDANLDGIVDQTDLNLVLTGWGEGGLGWGDGNFGGADAIDQFDLNAVLTNWGASSAPNFEGFAIPEPAAAAVLGLGGLALLRRRQG
ncbi:MAG: hypothetical protein AAGF84_04205 [Planctomycetota bacterium]